MLGKRRKQCSTRKAMEATESQIGSYEELTTVVRFRVFKVVVAGIYLGRWCCRPVTAA